MARGGMIGGRVLLLAVPLRALAQRSAFALLVGTAITLMILSQAKPHLVESLRTGVTDATAPILEFLSHPAATVAGAIDEFDAVMMVHHRNEHLTCPINDPESFYQTAACWRRHGPLARALYWAHDTLIGRLALGPAVAAWSLWRAEAGRIASGDFGNLAVWLRHLLGVAMMLYWVVGICGMPVWVYLVCFAYPGLSMILLRSYAEHRAAVEVDHRTATVEAGWPLALLYLNNNLHFSHHQEPGLAWYKLPARYRSERRQTLARNGNYRFAGYLDLFRRRLRRTEKVPVHPFAAVET